MAEITAEAPASERTVRRQRTRPSLIIELLVVLTLVKVYDWARSRATVHRQSAIDHAQDLLAVERALHVHWELAATRWLDGHRELSLLASWWYQFAHLTVTLGVLAWCYVRHPAVYRRARNALVGTNLAGLAVFLLVPMAPPRLLPGGGYVDAVADAGFGSTHGGPVPADQYAAMPSLHLAWATWTAVLLMVLLQGGQWRGWRHWQSLCLLYPATTAVAVVVTGNHYVLDVVAGVVVAAVACLVTGLLRAPKQPTPKQPAPKQSAPKQSAPRQPIEVDKQLGYISRCRTQIGRWRDQSGRWRDQIGRWRDQVSERRSQITRRRTRVANTNPDGTSGNQTVSSR